MNNSLYSFSLFLLWSAVAIAMLGLAPFFFPNMAGDPSRTLFMGLGASLLAVWNFVRWWSMRANLKHQQLVEEASKQRTNLQGRSTAPKPILNPEFQFEDKPLPLPGAPRDDTDSHENDSQAK